ncbi:phosphate signaling complex protein PhoU [Paenibacillus protaetiae]|uniref:Phosphate-specific transport system accessory protein PhoU n=1 Tax=Paenibacillus protaetiae TaxID=2509456 RepID=A0A4P6EUF8_9BACL|nr:phosphate signaling complex protein PhoU [Paenibacillus protaetiae]QAY66574.1 phosphate signaling complex protein PhoU [Paenibacillus protaetiae]
MVIRKELDEGLEQLKQMLVEMGERVENVLGESMKALQMLDKASAETIIKKDMELNQIEERISQVGAKIIATQQPVAKDLRRILIAFKMASDLERMGDLSVDIAKAVIRIQGERLIKPLIDLPRMAEICQTMIYESIQSYIREDIGLAYKMAKEDDTIDALYKQILIELVALMTETPASISQSIHLLFVGRSIERIADHATNIGESVVYLVTGKRPDLNL